MSGVAIKYGKFPILDGASRPRPDGMASSRNDCDVFLYGTEIQEGIGATLLSSAPKIMALRHWSAVIIYPDDHVAVCEGNPHAKTNVLTGQFSWKTKTEIDRMDAIRVPLGRHNLPIERVLSLMREMNRDEQYELLSNNCQTWLKELLDRLGIPVPHDAFADTAIGRNINRLVNGAEVDNELAYRRHNRQNHSNEFAERVENLRASSRGTQDRSEGAVGGRLQTANPSLSWMNIGMGVGAVVAGLVVLNRMQQRHRNE